VVLDTIHLVGDFGLRPGDSSAVAG